MYRILIEDKGTEGFGVLVDARVRAFSLITKRTPTDEEREAGIEESVFVTLCRGWASDFEHLGFLTVEKARLAVACLDLVEIGPVAPDEDEVEEEGGR